MKIILVLFVNGLSLKFFILGKKLNFVFVWNEASRKKNPTPWGFSRRTPVVGGFSVNITVLKNPQMICMS